MCSKSKKPITPLRMADRLLQAEVVRARRGDTDDPLALGLFDGYDLSGMSRLEAPNLWIGEILKFPTRLGKMPIILADAVAEYLQTYPKEFDYVGDFCPVVLPDTEAFVDYPSQSGVSWGTWLCQVRPEDLFGEETPRFHSELAPDRSVESLIVASTVCHMPAFGMHAQAMAHQEIFGIDKDCRGCWCGHHGLKIRDGLPEVVSSIHHSCRQRAWGALAAISLLNTKGVELLDVTEIVGRSAKWHRRTRTPHLVFKVLDVDGDREIVRRIRRAPGGKLLQLARHKVRRHRRFYTEERPHVSGFTGCMMISAHMRGSKKHGQVDKEYRPLPPRGVRGPGMAMD